MPATLRRWRHCSIRSTTPISRFTADGAYDGKPTYDAITEHSASAAVVIPQRVNVVERPDSDLSCQRERHVAAIDAGGG